MKLTFVSTALLLCNLLIAQNLHITKRDYSDPNNTTFSLLETDHQNGTINNTYNFTTSFSSTYAPESLTFNANSNEIIDDSIPKPPKLNEKAKTVRFIASVDNELAQMEKVFDLIKVKLNNNDLGNLKSITSTDKIIDPDSDEFFRSLKKRINF